MAPACPPRPATPLKQEQILNVLINEFNVQKNMPEVFNYYVWVDYIQHNSYVGQDEMLLLLRFLGDHTSTPP
ncbi:hypothetical protein ACQKWADRAFT_282723 [Trichoderma austrokoningii]